MLTPDVPEPVTTVVSLTPADADTPATESTAVSAITVVSV